MQQKVKADMNERHMMYILAIAEEGSISKAAAKHFISQPSLSQLLLNTENNLGVKLFDRQPRAIKLTFAGECYIEAAREIMQASRRLAQQINEISESRFGKLIVGITPNRAQYILPSVLPVFKKEYPNIELEIVVKQHAEELYNMLKRMKLDLAVLSYSYCDSTLKYADFPNEEMILVTPKNHWLTRHHTNADGSRSPVSLYEIASES